MNQRQNTFDQLNFNIKIFLESVILVFQFAETVDWFNDNLFDGTMTLHEAKSFVRIIGDREANATDCSLVQLCLSRISNRCEILGLEAMAYEAKKIAERLEQLEFVDENMEEHLE